MESTRHRPWSLFAGSLNLALGVVLLVPAVAGVQVPMGWSIGALVVGAAVELASGFELKREGAAWIAQVVSGSVLLFLGVFLIGLPPLVSGPFGPAPVALALGLTCVVNALFRGLDLWADRPSARLTEAIDVSVTFVIGALLFGFWRDASPWLVATAAGFELVAGSVAILGAAFAAWRHPRLPAYDDLQERLHHPV